MLILWPVTTNKWTYGKHTSEAAEPTSLYLNQLLQARAFFGGKQAGMEVTAIPVLIRIVRLRVYSKKKKRSTEYMYEQMFNILISAEC